MTIFPLLHQVPENIIVGYISRQITTLLSGCSVAILVHHRWDSQLKQTPGNERHMITGVACQCYRCIIRIFLGIFPRCLFLSGKQRSCKINISQNFKFSFMKITQGKEQLFQGGMVQMKPNHSAWLGAVSNNHPSLPELPTDICGIYVQMLCPSSSCKQARLIFWLKKGIHPGSQQTPRPWAKRCKEAECALVGKAEDFS